MVQVYLAHTKLAGVLNQGDSILNLQLQSLRDFDCMLLPIAHTFESGVEMNMSTKGFFSNENCNEKIVQGGKEGGAEPSCVIF